MFTYPAKMAVVICDFVVVDGRAAPLTLDAATIRAMANRRTGIGFDQLLSIDPDTVRREGAVLAKTSFDHVVAGVARFHDVRRSS